MRHRQALAPLVVVLALAGCGSGGGSTTTLHPAAPSSLAAVPAGSPTVDLGASDSAFGLDLLKTACAAAPSANQLLSPLSTSEALDLLAAGARGASATTLQSTLHQPAYGPALQAALATRGAALAKLDGKEDAPSLAVANRAYLQQGLAVQPGWLAAITAAQKAMASQVDFKAAPEAARGTINAAVKGDTGGHIAELMPAGSVTSDTRLVLTDALHLTANWVMPLEPRSTPQPFTTAAGATVQTPYLVQTGELAYATDGGWQSVAIPFSGGTLELDALLPPEGSTGCTLPDAATLGRLTHGTPSPVTVSVPPLTLDVRTPMTEVLTSLGLGPLFAPGADLSGIAGNPGDLLVSAVEHQATLSLTKDGVEASAATGISVAVAGAVAGPGAAPKVVHLDRPWLLEIRDTATGDPLFAGRVADPTAK